MRTDSVANWFLARSDAAPPTAITNMKLQKLVYLSESCYGFLYGTALVDQLAEAWDHGPVFADLYKQHRHSKANPIPAPRHSDQLPDDVVEVLETVWDLFGDRTASQLRNLTHDYGPYRAHYVKGQSHTSIPSDEIHAAWPMFAEQGASSAYRADTDALGTLRRLAAKDSPQTSHVTGYDTSQLMADYRAFSRNH